MFISVYKINKLNFNNYIIKESKIENPREYLIKIVEDVDAIWGELKSYNSHKVASNEMNQCIEKLLYDVYSLAGSLHVDIGDGVRRVVEERGSGEEE